MACQLVAKPPRDVRRRQEKFGTEEQLCLKKLGKISVPLWFCLLRERARRQVPRQEAIHFVWVGLQREAIGGSEG